MTRRHRYDYLLSALPGVEAWGGVPPLSKQDFLLRVRDAAGPVDSVKTLLLGDDLTQHMALVTGELAPERADLALLELAAEGAGTILPDQLNAADDEADREVGRVAVDGLWFRYFHHAQCVARRAGSGFLEAWVGFEVGLRNALCRARAQALELDPTSYLVAPELGNGDVDHAALLSAWAAAADPLAATEVLDRARWEWLLDFGRWFSFQADEIEAYTLKLILSHRWRRLARE